MRSPFFLLEDIVEELIAAFKGFEFDGKGDTVSPNIWIGHVPPKKSMPVGSDNKETSTENKEKSGDPPFLVVRYLEDEEKDDKNAKILEAKIGILCCVYSKDSYTEIKSGYKDIMNMADRVYLTLVKKRFWVKTWWLDDNIKRKYGLEKELSSIYEAGAHEHPYYGAAVVANFKAAAIARPNEVITQ